MGVCITADIKYFSAIFMKRAKCNSYKYSLFVRIVHDWNNVPQQVVEAGTFSLLKARLKSLNP